MKKHDEGYALVFVLIVMTVLGIVALTLMTGAMKNLQSQSLSLSQMQAKYQAEGEIEKAVVVIRNAFLNEGTVLYNDVASAQGAVEEILIGTNRTPWQAKTPTVREKSNEVSSAQWKVRTVDRKEKLDWSLDGRTCMITLVAEHANATINCTIMLDGILEYKTITGQSTNTETWRVTIPTIVYDSYTIDYKTPEPTPPAATKGG